MSGAPVFTSADVIFMAAAQRISLDCLALVAEEAWVPGPRRL